MSRNEFSCVSSFMEKKPSIYETIIYKANIFDRALLIKDILKCSFNKTIITAPSNFCNSTNLLLLEKFLAIPVEQSTGLVDDRKTCRNYAFFEIRNPKLFQDKEFFQKHFGTRPVIYLNFESPYTIRFRGMINSFRSVLRDSFLQFPYLQNSSKLSAEEINQFKKYFLVSCYLDLTKTEMINGVAFLAELLSKHFDGKKVFLLIDNYDSPISSNVFNERFDSIAHVRDLYKQMLKKTLSCNFLEKSVFAGEHCLDVFGLPVRGDYIKHYKFKNGSPLWLSNELVEVINLQDFEVNENLITTAKDFQVLRR